MGDFFYIEASTTESCEFQVWDAFSFLSKRQQTTEGGAQCIPPPCINGLREIDCSILCWIQSIFYSIVCCSSLEWLEAGGNGKRVLSKTLAVPQNLYKRIVVAVRQPFLGVSSSTCFRSRVDLRERGSRVEYHFAVLFLWKQKTI